ncbi:MAG: ATP phosphoribosyltransferase regulatory subunit [Pseudomonadota bacterium]
MHTDPEARLQERLAAGFGLGHPSGDGRAYFGAELAALNQVNYELTNIFNDAGFAPIEPAILQPADPLFELYGEEIWERAFVIEDAEQGSLCLRPDFTVPVARAHVAGAASARSAEARYGYFGPVFRRAPQEDGPGADALYETEPSPIQHLQAGIEVIRPVAAADGSEAELDAEVYDLAAKALKWAGAPAFETVVGDLGVIFSLLDALEMPPSWRKRLKRHFWRPTRFQQVLRGFAGAHAPTGASDGEPGRAAFLRAVGGLAPAEAEAAVLGMIAQFEIPQIGVRTAGEAAERFLRLSADAAEPPLASEALALVEDVIAVKGPLPEAVERLRAFNGRVGVDLSRSLDRLAARTDALGRRGVEVGALVFDAAFGRNLEYYDGFVFEMRTVDAFGDAPLKLGGGGRYDRLFQAIRCETPLAGVGAALRPEAIVAAKGVTAGGAS